MENLKIHLGGILLLPQELEIEHDNWSLFDMRPEGRVYFSAPKPYDLAYLRCYAFVQNTRYLDWLKDVEGCNLSNFYGILGSGWVCKHCGNYNPSGGRRCFRCAGLMEEHPFVKPYPMDMDVATVDAYWQSHNEGAEIIKAEIEFRTTTHTVDRMVGGRVFAAVNGWETVAGYYLCQYCGQSVKTGEICPGCGGGRRPLAEIVEFKRKCIYCGTDVPGGIVCSGCGARITGKTLKESLCTVNGDSAGRSTSIILS